MQPHSPVGFWARFKYPRPVEGSKYGLLPVQKFTDDGEALVFAVEVSTSHLVPATSIPDFKELVPDEREFTGGRKLIGAVPARDGWFLKTTKTGEVSRIEAWGVLETGDLIPIDDVPREDDPRGLEIHFVADDEPYYTLHRQLGSEPAEE